MALFPPRNRLALFLVTTSAVALGACERHILGSRVDGPPSPYAYGSIKDSPPEPPAARVPAVKGYVMRTASAPPRAEEPVKDEDDEPPAQPQKQSHHVLERQGATVVIQPAPAPMANHPLSGRPAASASGQESAPSTQMRVAVSPARPPAMAAPGSGQDNASASTSPSGGALPPVRLPSAVAPPSSAGPPPGAPPAPFATAPSAPVAAAEPAKPAPPAADRASTPSTAVVAAAPVPAPPANSSSATPAQAVPGQPATGTALAAAIEEARRLLAAGEILKSRERLQSTGSGSGNGRNPDILVELARTYDPNYLDRLPKKDALPNPALARALYEQAASFGSSAAAFDLLQLRRSNPDLR